VEAGGGVMKKIKTIDICSICGDEIRADEFYYNTETKKKYHLDCFLMRKNNDNKLPKSKSNNTDLRQAR